MKHLANLALLTTALFTGCSTMTVDSKKVVAYDFNAVKTYQWLQPAANILNEDDTLMDETLQKALNNELAWRGWRQVLDTAKADIQVTYFVKLREQEEYIAPPSNGAPQVNSGFTYDRESKNWSPKDNAPELTFYTVEIGTLHLAIDDARTGERIWTGSLETKLDRSRPLEERQAMYQKVAHKIADYIR